MYEIRKMVCTEESLFASLVEPVSCPEYGLFESYEAAKEKAYELGEAYLAYPA